MASFVLRRFNQFYSMKRFSVVAIIHKEYDFNAWILSYFSSEDKYATFPKYRSNLDLRVYDFHKHTPLELTNFVRSSSSKSKTKVMTLMDFELSEKINEKTPIKELLSVMHFLSSNCRNFELLYFKKALPYLERSIIEGRLSIYEQIQCMYYTSKYGSKQLGKQITSSVMRNMSKEQVETLTSNDLAIFCLSSFSSGVTVAETNILSYIVKQMLEGLSSNDISDSLYPVRLISFVKCLRLAGFYDDNLFRVLSHKLMSGGCLGNLPLTSMIHLIVYYCDALYSDTDFITCYIRKLVREIDLKIKLKKAVRLKDLNNLLYSVSNYCIKEINDTLNNSLIPNHIYYSFEKSNVPPSMMTNILLWLWIAQCDINDAVTKFITINNIRLIKDSDNFKDFAKLNLLLTCIYIESPNLLGFNIKTFQSNRLEPRMDKYLSKRPQLKRIMEFIKKNGEYYNLADVQIGFQVPGLYIGGIRTNHTSGQLDIEVIDDTVCLRNSKQLNGKMLLKLRLLRKMNRKFISIQANNSGSSDHNLESIENQLKIALLSYDNPSTPDSAMISSNLEH